MTGTLIDFEEHDESAEKTRFDRAVGVLTRYWGHKSFRQGQWDVVNAVLCRRDVMAILPTGTGKSVCYQIPGLMDSRPVLVVSPLIALMKDQVDNLEARGITCSSGSACAAGSDEPSDVLLAIGIPPQAPPESPTRM